MTTLPPTPEAITGLVKINVDAEMFQESCKENGSAQNCVYAVKMIIQKWTQHRRGN